MDTKNTKNAIKVSVSNRNKVSTYKPIHGHSSIIAVGNSKLISRQEDASSKESSQ